MKYDDVTLDICMVRDSLSLALMRYIPRSYGSSSTKLVLDFKENQPLALAKVRDLALAALGGYREPGEFRQGCLVALPPHTAHGVNAPCEYLCAELARAFPGLVHLKGAFQRMSCVEKSATAPPGKRPTFTDHVRSIRYNGPHIDCHRRVIMVDDVLTRGELARACRGILRHATSCKDVRGFFVAKTV